MQSRLVFVFFVFISISAFSQNADTLKHKLLRDKSIVVLPVVFRLPETRWGAGVGGSASFNFTKDSSWAKPSQVTFGLTFTQNKQILFFVPFKIFSKNNTYYFNSENGWYRYNYIYSGIGENKVKDEKFDTDYFRFRFLAAKHINATTYLGARINFENYKITGTQEGGELSSGIINGSDYSRTSGIGLSLIKDTRDAVFYPTKGIFGEAYVVPSNKIFGANRNFVKISVDVSKYASLGKKTVWANNVVGISNIGDVPFNQLAFLGGQNRLRGIYEGYFRDKNALILQTEFRQEIWKIIGAAAFGSVAFLGNETSILRMNLPKYTYGAGLRIATKNHLNLRLDYALSPYHSGNFYATIGEAF